MNLHGARQTIDGGRRTAREGKRSIAVNDSESAALAGRMNTQNMSFFIIWESNPSLRIMTRRFSYNDDYRDQDVNWDV